MRSWRTSLLARLELRSAVMLAADAAAFVAAFHAAYLVRFEGRIPPDFALQLRSWILLLVAIRLLMFRSFGVHRWSFRLAGLHEAQRVVLACLAGTLTFVTVAFLARRAGPPRSVIVIECLLTTALAGALRFWPRLGLAWAAGQRRSRSASRVRALIVGAGSSGELLLRDLRRSDEHAYDVVGFADDDRRKWGSSIGGRPVLGGLDRVPELARQRRIEALLFAIPRLPAERLRQTVAACADLKLHYRSLPVSFAFLNDTARQTQLHELAPEHLLPRHEARFSPERLDVLIRGRRVLITGAAGSIGSEIARQVAEHAPETLVLADVNESGLYLLYRAMRDRHPELDLTPEVVDIRDLDRVRQLGRQHRPQDVFHAAAHKHVPLMERSPEEAVKNNVIGTRNVAEMADEIAAERFVLVSTDKAVAPAGVMGASKRLAELLVFDLAARSRTGFTVVRFGNVLGSAGSVVPLFKAQIAAGGPVTVTHADCTRYLMTVHEAVGLVLLAGLSRPAPLCILEMGEPIRILDLARLMITLAGCVPEQDIRITFTGLRPGEKLEETLMSPEEAGSSRLVEGLVRAITPANPPANLAARLAALERLARRGDRPGLLQELRAAVPTYRPFAAPAEARREDHSLASLAQ